MRFLIILALSVISVQSSRIRRQSIVFGSPQISNEPETCTTPDERKGICTRLADCPPLYTRLRTNPTNEFINFLRASLCRNSGPGPFVCCSTEVQPTSTTTRRPFFLIGTRATTTTTTTTAKSTTKTITTEKPPLSEDTSTPSDKGETEDSTVEIAETTKEDIVTIVKAPGVANVDDILPKSCGVPNITSTSTRIVGGRIADKGAWPWLAALGYRTKQNIEFLCGGALITNLHILTAAHCVDQRSDLEIIRLGEHDLRFTDEAAHEDIPISKVEAHSQYDSSNFENDIAIITLAHPVKFKENILPGCLPINPKLARNDFIDRRAFVAGWGSIAYNNVSSPILKEAMVPIRTNEDCQESYARFKSILINSQRLCAGDGGEDACQGDSGGPLMLYEFEEEKYYLLGIVSVGFRCAEAEFPGIYIKVPSYINWIMSHLV